MAVGLVPASVAGTAMDLAPLPTKPCNSLHQSLRVRLHSFNPSRRDVAFSPLPLSCQRSTRAQSERKISLDLTGQLRPQASRLNRVASRQPHIGVGGFRVKAEASATTFSGRAPNEVNIVVVGSTGYIGKFVTNELVNRGYHVIAITREQSGIGGKKGVEETKSELNGAEVVVADVTDAASLDKALAGRQVDAVVSCLASRTGGIKDSWLIDYTATKNSLDAGLRAGAKHFVLLSAICVQKPLLAFQRAKLKFEEELMAQPGITYSIVRPTAFFKSLGGQVESVKSGGPYVMFGDGQLCACKPISENDLASFIADCLTDPEKRNKVLPIGGPGEALTPLQQGTMLFQVLGKEPRFVKVPIEIMDFVIGALDFLAKYFKSLEDAAEFAKIGRYYAAESMLVWDPARERYDAEATPGYGRDTLQGFFDRVVKEGMAGQELGDQAVFK